MDGEWEVDREGGKWNVESEVSWNLLLRGKEGKGNGRGLVITPRLRQARLKDGDEQPKPNMAPDDLETSPLTFSHLMHRIQGSLTLIRPLCRNWEIGLRANVNRADRQGKIMAITIIRGKGARKPQATDCIANIGVMLTASNNQRWLLGTSPSRSSPAQRRDHASRMEYFADVCCRFFSHWRNG